MKGYRFAQQTRRSTIEITTRFFAKKEEEKMGAYEGYQYIKLKSGELTYGCIYKLINTKQKVLEHYKNLAAVLITKKDVDYTFLDFIETWESDGWIFDFDDNELREIVFIANKIYIAICSNKEEIAKTITWIQ